MGPWFCSPNCPWILSYVTELIRHMKQVFQAHTVSHEQDLD